MKMTMTLVMLLVLFLTACGKQPSGQQDTQLYLPDDAVARLGKGEINEIQCSPDGARLAVLSTIGIWLYDTTTYRAVALLSVDTGRVYSVVFSPDGSMLAGGSEDGTVLLWKITD